MKLLQHAYGAVKHLGRQPNVLREYLLRSANELIYVCFVKQRVGFVFCLLPVNNLWIGIPVPNTGRPNFYLPRP